LTGCAIVLKGKSNSNAVMYLFIMCFLFNKISLQLEIWQIQRVDANSALFTRCHDLASIVSA
jgi:cytochrome oxidase assembly protein ShyY1